MNNMPINNCAQSKINKEVRVVNQGSQIQMERMT